MAIVDAIPGDGHARLGGTGLAGKVALNSSLQAARQLFIALAGIVSVGVATRYLSVNEYGGVVAALVLLSLFSVAADFGIAAMTVRAMARDPGNEVAIQSSAFWIWVAFSIPTALFILGVAQIAYPGPDHVTTRHAVLILMATFPLVPLGGVAMVRAVFEQRVWVASVASIIARALALLGVVLAAVLRLGPLGITAGFASGYVLESAFTVLFVRPRVKLSVGLDRARIRSLIVAAIPLGAVLVLNGLYFRLDAFMLSVLGTERDLALYGVAYKAFDTLLALPGFVMITLIPVLSSLEPTDPRFQELMQKAFTGMCILAMPIAGFSLLGGDAMVALAGSRYRRRRLVLTLILCSVAFSCVQVGCSGTPSSPRGASAAC